VNKIEKLRLDQRSALSAPCASERIRVYWCSFVVENRLCPAYPRLSAPKRGKTRLNGPNRANNFPGGSRASIRACATNRTNLHQVAQTCAKTWFCRFALVGVHSRFSPHIGKSSRIKLNIGKYNQLNPPKILPHKPARNPDLNLAADLGRRPARTCSELFRSIQSCSDLIFNSPSGNLNALNTPVTPVSRPASVVLVLDSFRLPSVSRPATRGTSRSRSETLTVERVGPAPVVAGEPNLNAPSAAINSETGTLTSEPRWRLTFSVLFSAVQPCSAPFSVKSFICNHPHRSCASETATAPQRIAATGANSHLLAPLASTCAERKLWRRIAFEVPPSGGLSLCAALRSPCLIPFSFILHPLALTPAGKRRLKSPIVGVQKSGPVCHL